MSQKHDAESLEQANDWLTKRLQYTEQQVHEGEEVNTTLTEENRLLKEVSVIKSRNENKIVIPYALFNDVSSWNTFL